MSASETPYYTEEQICRLVVEGKPFDAMKVLETARKVQLLLSTGGLLLASTNNAEARIRELEDALRWYVETDETMNTAYNAPWLEGKRRAMRLLGMETDDD